MLMFAIVDSSLMKKTKTKQNKNKNGVRGKNDLEGGFGVVIAYF